MSRTPILWGLAVAVVLAGCGTSAEEPVAAPEAEEPDAAPEAPEVEPAPEGDEEEDAEGSSPEEIDLPSTLIWTALGPGSGTYTMSSAFGDALRQETGTTLRIVPGDTAVARAGLLLDGEVDFNAATTSEVWAAAEGVDNFAAREWGPQPINIVFGGWPYGGSTMVARADAGIETPFDLEGKRLAYMSADATLSRFTDALLAFAGLTHDDVELVEVSGYVEGVSEALIDNRADVSLSTTPDNPTVEVLASSPVDFVFIDFPTDPEADARMLAVAPFFARHSGTTSCIANLCSEDEPLPHELFAGPLPVITVREDLDADVAYATLRAIDELYDVYKDATGQMRQWELAHAVEAVYSNYPAIVHEGAVGYLEDQGLWTDEMQQHRDTLLERQAVLAEAWDRATSDGSDVSDDDWVEYWLEIRREALEAAGLDVSE